MKMYSSSVYYIKRNLINRVKQLRYKPLKVIGKLLILLYFINLPFILRQNFKNINFDSPEGYVAVFAVLMIYFGIPGTLSYLKRRGIIFKQENVNFDFIAPFTPKQILLKGFTLNAFYGLILQLAMAVGGYFVFHLKLWQVLLIFMIQLTVSLASDFAIAVIIYASEDLTEKHKQIIRYVTFGLLFIVALYMIWIVVEGTGPVSGRILRMLNSDPLMFVPIYGFEIGVVSLIIKGYTLPRLVSTILSFLTTIILVILAKKCTSTGEYYEDAIKFSEDYRIAVKKNKETGKSHRVGKKQKVIENAKFTIKGNYAKAIFEKQLNEYKKLPLLDKIKLPAFAVLASLFFVFIFGDEKFGEGFSAVLGAISIYINLISFRFLSVDGGYNHYSFYLIPDTMGKKVFYSGLLGNIKTLVVSICLFFPFFIITGQGPLRILGAVLMFNSISLIFNYLGKGIIKVLESRLGRTFGMFAFIIIGLILSGISLGIGTVVEVFSKVTDVGFFVTAAIAILISIILLFINGKLYKNMEFITEE